MKIIISPLVEKELKKIPKTDQIVLARKIRLLINVPISGEEKLKGYANIYRVRVGSYRIVYKRTSNLLYIVLIGHRKDIYHLLKELFG